MGLPEPFYDRDGIQLYCGDCLDAMRAMDAGGVSAVVTDPPYGQSNEGYDKGVRPEVWAECRRVATADAALVSFAGSPTYHRIASDIEAAGWTVRQMWGWIYRDGFITSAWPKEGFDRLAPAFDPICFATTGKVLLSLEREGDIEWDRASSRRPGSPIGYSGRSGDEGKPAAVAKGRWPRAVVASEGVEGFQYFVLSRTTAEPKATRTNHPNQKPAPLMEWIVGKLPGGSVLDPFAGSGTTGVACARLGVAFVGVEQNEAYCEIAARRLDAELDARAGKLFA